MNVVIFGASGTVGSGVLLECLDSPHISRVHVVGRSPTGVEHDKLTEIGHRDFLDFSAIEDQLQNLDACLWCLGITANGMSEADYTRVTHDFTKAGAQSLLRASPGITMCFVSGWGTDSTEQGRQMWANVKGRTENLLQQMGFEQAYMFRPAGIQPVRGAKPKTKTYRVIYALMTPLWPVAHRLFGNFFTTNAKIGRAMIRVAKEGFDKPILNTSDINALAALPQ